MEEDPKHHDFDQRHDGPLGRPSLHMHRRSSSRRRSRDVARSLASPTSPSSPDPLRPRADPITGEPISEKGFVQEDEDREGRVSTSQTPRRSTQMSRSMRPSRDFDRRVDGPFGRPSLTLSRRRSSGQPISPVSGHGHASEPNVPPIVFDEDELQDVELQPHSAETTQTFSDPAFQPEPPPLNYTLWIRKRSIAYFWGLVLFDSIVMPLGLYFGLWYGLHVHGKMSANTVFSIVTAALGGVSILEYILRFRRLWRKDSTCRVIGARRMYLDWFHWNFSLGWVVIMVELIIGTIPENPPIRLLAMPVPSMLYVFALELLVIDIMRFFELPAPIRISSIPKGAQLRPGIYSMIEDVIAADGGGGTAYREALNKRYEASHVFRAMLRRIGLFWSFGAMAMAVVCTILIFTVNKDAAYCIGWALPFLWAFVWIMISWWYVNKKLREEKIAWSEEVAEKSRA